MKMEAQIRMALDATGLPWEISQGRGHQKIRLAGHLVGVVNVVPSESGRPTKNIVAQIRRKAKEITK